ncbi:hypothetical protein D3C85_1051690 [compost metagenome]
MGIPDIEVAHLRANRRCNPEHMPARNIPGAAGANRHFERLDQRAPVLRVAHPFIEGLVHLQGRAFADLIGRRIVFVHGKNPRSVMGRWDDHLQKEMFGIVEIETHRILGGAFITLDQQLMDLSVANQPGRLET